MKKTYQISESEWLVLRCLWKQSPLEIKDILAMLREETGWNANMVRAMVVRLQEKGAIGAEKFPGTKLMCLSDDVNNKVCVELPTNATLCDVVEGFGGGVANGKKLKAIQLGGSSCGFVTPDQLDTPIDFDSIRSIGAALGSGAVYVIDETRNVVDILLEIAKFFQHESCGKCTPCREGTMRVAELMEKLAKGEGTQKDIELLQTLADYMQKTCFCPLGQSATTAFMSALKLFPEDFAVKLRKEA